MEAILTAVLAVALVATLLLVFIALPVAVLVILGAKTFDMVRAITR